MKDTTATKTKPVIQKVMIMVASIVPQFEAIGVHHHGLRRWNATEPMTRASRISATCIRTRPAGAPPGYAMRPGDKLCRTSRANLNA